MWFDSRNVLVRTQSCQLNKYFGPWVHSCNCQHITILIIKSAEHMPACHRCVLLVRFFVLAAWLGFILVGPESGSKRPRSMHDGASTRHDSADANMVRWSPAIDVSSCARCSSRTSAHICARRAAQSLAMETEARDGRTAHIFRNRTSVEE